MAKRLTYKRDYEREGKQLVPYGSYQGASQEECFNYKQWWKKAYKDHNERQKALELLAQMGDPDAIRELQLQKFRHYRGRSRKKPTKVRLTCLMREDDGQGET